MVGVGASPRSLGGSAVAEEGISYLGQPSVTGLVQLSDRPSDAIHVRVDRVRRVIELADVNGAIFATIACPAKSAGLIYTNPLADGRSE